MKARGIAQSHALRVSAGTLKGGEAMSNEELTRRDQEGTEESKLLKKIEKWRANRAQLLEHGEGPTPTAGKVTALFHVIPSGSLRRRVLTHSWSVPEQDKSQIYVSHQVTSSRYNAEGFLAVADFGKGGCAGYTQLFRSGIVEYANSSCSGQIGDVTETVVFGQQIEQEIVHCYEDAKQHLRSTGEEGPTYIGLTLVGIANKTFYTTYQRMVFSNTRRYTTQNVFISPEVLVDPTSDEASPYGGTLRPLVDTMWQIAGFEETPFQCMKEWAPFKETR
jgi:hypothetical protein